MSATMKREDVIQLAREACDKTKVDAFYNGYWTITQDELERVIHLATQKAVAEERERLNWIERQDLEELLMGVVIDAPHDGEYYVNGNNCVTYYGPTLRDAIDNAIRARKDHI